MTASARDNAAPFAAPQAEALLLARLRAGDARAFESLVRSASGRMLAVARRFLRSESDAQDAVQDAFLQAYRALPTFAERSSLTTWLHAITVRTCLMRLRAARNRREESIDPLLPRFLANGHRCDPGSRWPPADAQALDDEQRTLIRSCIDRLPDDFRNVLLLRDISELDTRQAADLLGVTEGVIKTRLHRARQALRTLLDPHFRTS